MTAGGWCLETSAEFDRRFRQLDRPVQQRVLACLLDVAGLADPRQRGKALTEDRSGTWRYRIGDYRVIATFRNEDLVIVALTVGHRGSVY